MCVCVFRLFCYIPHRRKSEKKCTLLTTTPFRVAGRTRTKWKGGKTNNQTLSLSPPPSARGRNTGAGIWSCPSIPLRAKPAGNAACRPGRTTTTTTTMAVWFRHGIRGAGWSPVPRRARRRILSSRRSSSSSGASSEGRGRTGGERPARRRDGDGRRAVFSTTMARVVVVATTTTTRPTRRRR